MKSPIQIKENHRPLWLPAAAHRILEREKKKTGATKMFLARVAIEQTYNKKPRDGRG